MSNTGPDRDAADNSADSSAGDSVDIVESRRFHESLPTKRMGAGAVICDESGRVLIVNPTYKSGWELPGGVVGTDESPAQACRREIGEELGLTLDLTGLLCVDYNSSSPDYAESLMFLFSVDPLSTDQIASIRIREVELSEYRFCAFDEACALLSPRVGARLSAVSTGGAPHRAYLEDRRPVF